MCNSVWPPSLAHARIIDHRDNLKSQDLIDNLGLEPYR
jgi:hypothetical protein